MTPGAAELPDGLDNNCNGWADEESWSEDDSPYLRGDSAYTWFQVLTLGDVDGDGQTEVVAAGVSASEVYSFSGPAFRSWAGIAADEDEFTIGLSSSWDVLDAHADTSGDVTADGLADLVFAGDDSGSMRVKIFGSPLRRESGATPDAFFTLGTDASDTPSLHTGWDFDGDGVAEVALGNDLSNQSGANYGGSVAILQGGTTTGSLGWSDVEVRLNGTGNTQCGQDIEPGDYDGDGNADLAVGCTEGGLYVWLGDGLATRGTSTLDSVASTVASFDDPFGATRLLQEDLDADGRDDVVWSYSGETSWLLAPAGRGAIDGDVPDAWGEFGVYAAQGALDADGDGARERLWATYGGTDSLVFTLAHDAGDDGVVTLDEALWSYAVTDYAYAWPYDADLDGDGDDEVLVNSFYIDGYTGALLVGEP